MNHSGINHQGISQPMRWRWSLSTRLLLLFLAAAVLTLTIIVVGFRAGKTGHWRDRIEPHLFAYLEYLQRDLGSPPDPKRAAELQQRLPLDIQLSGPGLDTPAPPPVRFRHHHGRFAVGHHAGHLYLRTRDGDYSITFRVQARPEPGLNRWRIAVIGALLLVLLGLYLAIRRLLRPLQRLAKGVERIGDGELDTRIEAVRPDEIGQLTDRVNRMAEQIEQMLEAKRQLLLAISHELRSPITRARLSTELLPASASRDAIRRDLATMARLIDELLEGERLQHRHSALQREQVCVAQLVSDLVAEFYPTRGLAIEHLGHRDAVSVDPARVRLLLRNLIDNALAHTPPGTVAPAIRTRQTRQALTIEVLNQGPAIPPDQLPHLTEPFYRADPSRRRATGGIGLGLWLCRAIAQAHGGSLSIDSGARSGTRVVALLPLRSETETATATRNQ